MVALGIICIIVKMILSIYFMYKMYKSYKTGDDLTLILFGFMLVMLK